MSHRPDLDRMTKAVTEEAIAEHHRRQQRPFAIAANQGRTAAVKGVPYDRNPYDRKAEKALHLAWSEAHNGMRARMALDKERGLLNPKGTDRP